MNLKIMGFALLLVNSPLLAQSTQSYDALDRNERELRKVSDQEIALRKRMTDLQLIAQRMGYLGAWRDQIFLGKAGVKSRVDAWVARADGWLKSWTMLVDLGTNRDKAALGNMSVTITDFMRTQSDALLALQRDGLTLKSELNTRKIELQQLNSFSSSLVPGRENEMRMLMQRQNELLQAFTGLEQAFALGGFETLKTRHDAILATLESVFKQRMTEFPELKAAIESARSLLALEARYRTRVLALEKRSLDNRRLTSLYALYAAQKDLESLRSESTALASQLQAEPKPGPLGQEFLNRTQNALLRAQDHWDRISQTASADYYFERYMNDRRAVFTRDCRLDDVRLTRDCDLLRSLNALKIDSTSVTKLSDSDRLLLQQKLEAVAQGPSFVRKNP